MLSNEWMGAFCLGVVWLNTLLIAAHVMQSARALRAELRNAGDPVEARVLETGGAASLAEVHVAQRGRAITTGGPDRILLTESSRTSVAHGGVVEVGGERVAVVPEPDRLRVWPLATEGEREGDDFDAAYRAASTNRGLTSELALPVGVVGRTLWLAGRREGGSLHVRLVADTDPRRVVAAGQARAYAFVALSLAVLAGITALALVRPWFSGWSTLGGALAVAYFLSVQPLAVALREGIAPPDQRRLGGVWARPS